MIRTIGAVTRKAAGTAFGIAAGLTLALAAPALAQDGGPEAKQTVVEKSGAWVFECTEQGGREFCTIQQVLSNAETEQVLLHVTIAYHPQTADLLMVNRTPLGVELPIGLGLKIDEGRQMAAPYTNCTQAGCRATAPLTDELVANMKAGNTMTISYGYLGKRLDAPVSLEGFTAAFNRLAERKPVASQPSLTPTPGPATQQYVPGQ